MAIHLYYISNPCPNPNSNPDDGAPNLILYQQHQDMWYQIMNIDKQRMTPFL